jgi:hypothetical protein
MQLVTPEEIARNVARELQGGNTGREVVAALDGAIMGPSYRGGYLRQAAIKRLRQLEAEHGDSIAFEILGPPRLSKLLFEAYLLKRACRTGSAIWGETGESLAAVTKRQVLDDQDLRCRIISIGVPILLSDGERLLRGSVVKAKDARHGWVDLRADNMSRWQARLKARGESIGLEAARDSSSRSPLGPTTGPEWCSEESSLDVGEIVAWILIHEDQGLRGKD